LKASQLSKTSLSVTAAWKQLGGICSWQYFYFRPKKGKWQPKSSVDRFGKRIFSCFSMFLCKFPIIFDGMAADSVPQEIGLSRDPFKLNLTHFYSCSTI